MGQVWRWKANISSFSPDNNPSVSVIINIILQIRDLKVGEYAWGDKERKQQSRDLNLTL